MSKQTQAEPCVLYIRVSTVRQANQGVSLKAQIARGILHAQYQNFLLPNSHIFIDSGVSAKTPLWSRPAGKQMKAFIDLEGGAEFMTQSLYSEQDGSGENYLREVMQRKLEMSQDGYNAQNTSLDQLTYSSEVNVYDVGAWFIAYLIHHEGDDAFINGFYGDLTVLGLMQPLRTTSTQQRVNTWPILMSSLLNLRKK